MKEAKELFAEIAGDKEQLVYRNIASDVWQAWLKFSKPTALQNEH